MMKWDRDKIINMTITPSEKQSTDIRELIKVLADDLSSNFSVTKEGEVTIEIESLRLTVCKKSNWYFNIASYGKDKEVKNLDDI